MPHTEPFGLRAALRAAGPRPGATVMGASAAIPMAAIASGTVFGAARDKLAGLSVLLVTSDQLTAALAMADLDGLVRRMMICPPDMRADHRASIIADAEVDVIVSDLDETTFAGLGAPVVRCGIDILPLDERALSGPALATQWVMATSGTSGLPKLVAHSLSALTAAIAPVPVDRPMVWGTFYDIRRYGGMQIYLRALLAGCSMILSEAGEPLPAHLERLRAGGITHLSGTPSHWRRVLMSEHAGLIAPSIVRLSGEIADQAVLDSLAVAYPTAKVGHAYASTEAGVGFEVSDGLEGFPVGYLDQAGNRLMKVEDGSLRIRSDRLASGYLGADPPALTDADGFVDTGDMVEERGGRLYFVGRRGGIINVGGLKVHPEEIEAVINRNDSVRMSLVKARRSPITGSIVVAEVVLQGDAPEDRVRDEILQACKAGLPVHKVPAMIRFVPSLDVTAAGKLSRPSSPPASHA